MKVYADNQELAGQLLEIAFSILHNEGLQPVNCMEMVYSKLMDGVDVSKVKRAALLYYLKQVVDEAAARRARRAGNE